MVRESEKGERSHEGESKTMGNPVYMKWLLEAIHKIKHQKQRPSVERISHAVRQHHKVSPESIEEQLELAVKEGIILKVMNKGLCSYKDPNRLNNNTGSTFKRTTLKIAKKTDLTKVVVRTIQDLGEIGGSTLKSIEKYIRKNYNLDITDGSDLAHQVRLSVKRGINSGQLIQDHRLYRVGRGHNESVGSSNPINLRPLPSPVRSNNSESEDEIPLASAHKKVGGINSLYINR